MKGDDPVRYLSDAGKLIVGEVVRFPITVVGRKPTFEAGLQAVKAVLADLQRHATDFQIGDVTLDAQSVRCQLEPKSVVLVELSAELVVKWVSASTEFWTRIEGVVRCLDLLQRFCDQMTKSGSDIGFYTARVNNGGEEYVPKK